jgi:4-amino-4-deoxy-L-arabinose transferase-like glycosyltransferase
MKTKLLAPAVVVAALAALAIVVLRLAVAARIAPWLAPVVVPLAAVAPVLALSCTDSRQLARLSWWKEHPSTTLTVWALLVGLPLLGTYSLVDPWESHYAEVAREMLERHDLLSPWWAHDGWFRSKPVLLFWLEALSMKLLGVGTGPHQLLAGALGAAHPEYAVRLPGLLAVVAGGVVLQKGLARLGPRLASGVALVFLTMSGTVLLAHQAITDTPLLGATAASLGLLAAAELASPDAAARVFELRLGRRALALHAGHLVAALLLLAVVPQLLVIVTAGPVHAGSPHACTLPGQPACAEVRLAHAALSPWLQLLFWAPLLAALAASFAAETRLDRLLVAGAWFAAGIGTMAKGPVGLVVPAAGAFLALVSGRSLRPLLRLEILRGPVLVALLVLPWYLAMYARHGRPFLDELVMRNMLGRTLDHLHDTNGSEDTGVAYFVKQLGYGTFPWSGLAAVAMLTAARRADQRSPHDRVRALFFGSALATFVLVSTMGTKFHHYVLVALPGVAGVTGMFLEERIAAAASRTSRGAARWTWPVLLVVATALTWLVARDFTVPVTDDPTGPSGAARFFHLLTYRYDRRWISSAQFLPLLVVAGPLFALALAPLGWVRRRLRPRVLGAFLALATLSAVWLGNVYPAVAAHDGGQRELLARYESERAQRHDSGPLVAWELNWKGENFYTGNDVAVFLGGGATFHAYVESERARGHALYIVTERPRLRSLRSELGAGLHTEELVTSAACDEFVLIRVAPPS